MVNPVNNNITTEYQPSAGRAVKVESNEHFSLNNALNEQKQAQDGVIYDTTENKEANTPTGSSSSFTNNKKDSFESSLDKAIKRQSESESGSNALRESLKELWHNISSFFSGLWFNIKKIFGNVWDSKPLAEGVESMRREANTASDGSNTIAHESNNNPSPSSIEELEASRDKQIRKALSEGDREQFRSLISEDGKKLPAHNTSMLTTYDANGQLVSLNPSDENKILHGDRNTKKL